MKEQILLLLASLVISCNETTKSEKVIADKQIESLTIDNGTLKSETETKNKSWYNDLIADYIKKSENKLIKIALKNNERIEWLLDRTEKTDSTNYYIFNIGQDVTDENNTNPRFSSNGWIYVDSISKKIYEYDLPNDSLVLWKNKHYR